MANNWWNGWWGGLGTTSPSQSTVITNQQQSTAIQQQQQAVSSGVFTQQNTQHAMAQAANAFANASNNTVIIGNYPWTQNNHSQYEIYTKEIKHRCDILEKEISEFSPVVREILNTIKPEINSYNSLFNMTGTSVTNEEKLQTLKKLGIIIDGQIKKHVFASKLEDIINDDD